MNLVGFDLNATRVRVVSGPPETAPHTLYLDGVEAELPLALSLEGRSPAIGRAGVGIARRAPHLACLDFLPYLGTAREWVAGRHRLDAAGALALVFAHLQSVVPASPKGSKATSALVLALPGYFTPAQTTLLATLVQKVRWSLLGSVTVPLAAALAAQMERPWVGRVVVIDADDHALTCTVVGASEGRAHVLGQECHSNLGLLSWKERLLDAIADRCVHHSRRDPRDSAAAEQMLYNQLDDVLQASAGAQMVEVVLQATNWCQNLILQPRQIDDYCAALVQQTIEEIEAALAAAPKQGPMSAIILTAAAASLPGLSATLAANVGNRVVVLELPPDMIAYAAHQLAVCCYRDGLPQAHFEVVAPFLSADDSQPAAKQAKRARGAGA
jgi:molecular chaperone DnaK (HSP70)